MWAGALLCRLPAAGHCRHHKMILSSERVVARDEASTLDWRYRQTSQNNVCVCVCEREREREREMHIYTHAAHLLGVVLNFPPSDVYPLSYRLQYGTCVCVRM